jgi:hypothetical protein
MNELIARDSTLAATPNGDAPSADAIAHAVVLVVEGLVSDAQFTALTGRPVDDINSLLADPEMLSRVQKLSLELQNKGALARLEALKHARSAVQVTASILHNEEIHPGQRLAAAAELHKVAGTAKPPADRGTTEKVRITINVPGESPLVIDTQAIPTTEGDDQ